MANKIITPNAMTVDAPFSTNRSELPKIFQPAPSPFTNVSVGGKVGVISNVSTGSSGGSVGSSGGMTTIDNPTPSAEYVIGEDVGSTKLPDYVEKNIAQRASVVNPSLELFKQNLAQRQGQSTAEIYSSNGLLFKVPQGKSVDEVFFGVPKGIETPRPVLPGTTPAPLQLETPSNINQVTKGRLYLEKNLPLFKDIETGINKVYDFTGKNFKAPIFFGTGKKVDINVPEALREIENNLDKNSKYNPFEYQIKLPIFTPGAGSFDTGFKGGDFIRVAGELVPKTPREAGTYYILGKSFEYIPKITSTAFTALGAYNLKNAETNEQKILSSLQIAGGSLGLYGEIAPKVIDRYLTMGMEKVKLADYDQKPFTRKGEDVFMKRYEGIDLLEPKKSFTSIKEQIKKISKDFLENKRTTQLLSGEGTGISLYKKGQFVERTYRKIAPEVQARAEGKAEVTAWFYNPKTKSYVYETRKTTPFPYEDPSLHYKYFTELNPKLYPITKKGELIVSLKDIEATGSHVTPNKFTGNKKISSFFEKALGIKKSEPELYQLYISGKGYSIRFAGLSEEPYSKLGLNIKTGKPQVIETLLKDIKFEKAIKELRDIPNPYEKRGKPIKQYLFKEGIKIEEGKAKIPGLKREVEAVIRDKGISLRENQFFVFQGRRIRIEQRLYGKDLKSEVQSLKKLGKSEKDIFKEAEESYIPTKYDKKITPQLPYYKSEKVKSSYVESSKSYLPSSSSKVSSSISSSSPSSISRSISVGYEPTYDYSRRGSSGSNIPRGSSYSYNERRDEGKPFSYEPPYLVLKGRGKMKRTKIKPKSRKLLFLEPSFTAQQLGRTIIIKEKDLYKEATKFKLGGLRGIPKLIRNG